MYTLPSNKLANLLVTNLPTKEDIEQNNYCVSITQGNMVSHINSLYMHLFVTPFFRFFFVVVAFMKALP